MAKSERTVLDVLFPKVRAKLLLSFFANPAKQHYVRELMQATGLALHTIQDELRKLTPLGLLTTWSNGYHRFYRANRDHPMYALLVRMVQVSETLPRTTHSALYRPRGGQARQKRIQRKSRRMPVDRPVNWNLFSQASKTRRL